MTNNSNIHFGFKSQDERHINKYDNAESNPDLQVFTDEDDEDDEDKLYYCAMCKGRLQYLQSLQEWYCNSCVQYYDTKIQDKPIKDLQDFKLTPYSALRHYPTMDENDPLVPFVQNINVDELAGEADHVELVKSSPDTRIQHIKVKGNLAEALAATREL